MRIREHRQNSVGIDAEGVRESNKKCPRILQDKKQITPLYKDPKQLRFGGQQCEGQSGGQESRATDSFRGWQCTHWAGGQQSGGQPWGQQSRATDSGAGNALTRP